MTYLLFCEFHIFNLILILIIIALAIWALKLEQELKRRNRGSAPANLPVAKEVGEDLEEPEEEGVLKNLDDEDDWDNWLDDDSQPTLDKLN